jgi:hypothetical protein
MLTFFSQEQLVMACHITGVYDVNRNNTLQDDDFALVKDWAESMADVQLKGIIFHNNFTEDTCKKQENDYVSFVKVAYNAQFNPNVFRYFVYRDFLRTHAAHIDSLFITDVSDVVAVKNPFIEPLFTNNPTALFCGDEPKQLDNEWMKDHASHLRGKIDNYEEYEDLFQKETLLNCGIVGGNTPVMQDFIEKLCLIHQQYNHDNTTAFTGDMGAFNYLARTQFNEQLLHGAPVNTVFKMYEKGRGDCWFRHK